MTYKRAVIVALFLYIAGTLLLWPHAKELLPSAGNQPMTAVVAEAEISQVSPQAPVSLMTELEDTQMEQELVAAHERGVAVRVILQNLNNFGNHPNQAAFDFLQAHGVPVEWAPSYFPLTHQKTLMLDSSKAFIMTFNLQPQYYGSSRDFGIVDKDAADVSAIEAAFNADWEGRQIFAGNGSDLVWSPGSANTLLAMIQSASTSLDVYNEEMVDPRIITALEQAAARGVDVRLDMTYDTSWKAALQTLAAAGVNVRTYASTAKLYIHAKVIVADGSEAFVGSENFSAQSLDANRELGVLIKRADILTSLESTFGQDWAGSRPFVSN